MSKKSSNNSPSSSASKARLAQVAGFLAGAVLVLTVAVWAIRRDSAPAADQVQPVAAEANVAALATPAAPAPATEFTRVSAAELKGRVERGEVTLIDVRDIDSYLAGHIPGSLHIPVSLIEGEISYLPKGKPIVTYCTCPAEESSGVAAQILQHGGITDVAALLGGLQAWKDAGGSIETGRPAAAPAGM